MNNESHKLKGEISFELRDKQGNLKDTWHINNLIVNTGLASMAGLLIDADSIDPFTAIAIGTGTTAVTATDTALESEITTNGGARRSGGDVTRERVTGDVANDSSRLITTFTFTGSLAITESGIFNDASAGQMLARQVFAVRNVQDADTLQVTWTIKHS